MYDLKVCIVCLSTDIKLYSLNTGCRRNDYNLISGLKTSTGTGMPEYLCYECNAYVKNFKKFRDKCQRGHYTLQELLLRNKEITETHIQNINCQYLNIKRTLSFIDPNKSHYDESRFQWSKFNRAGLKADKIPTVHCGTLNQTFDNVANIEIEINENNIKEDTVYTETFNDLDLHGKVEDVIPSTSNVELADSFIDDNNGNLSDCNNEQDIQGSVTLSCEFENGNNCDDADGSNLNEEYAVIVPVSAHVARAVKEVYKYFSNGKYRCGVCQKSYANEKRLKIHSRMHDKHTSGNFHCELCDYYYKTQFLLKTHITDKHMYKYLCKKCPEVNFDRTSAKQHYIWTHLHDRKATANWYDANTRPSWLSSKGGKRVKGVLSLKPVRKLKEVPKDFLVYSPISQEEQYSLVQERQKSRNYREAQYKCDMCYRGFREMATYGNHMRKHDPSFAGPLQCDMCKLQFQDQRKMYKHMNITHLFRYACQMCSFVCTNKGQAQMHYRWHKNVTYQCPHCDKEFKKASTQLTHIRIKHPSMFLCNLCGHSFVSETGLYYHKLLTHTKQEKEMSENLLVNPEDPYYCADCNMQFMNEAAFSTHLGSSYKHATTNVSTKPCRKLKAEGKGKRGRPRRGACSEILNNGVSTATTCEVCGQALSNDVQARRHYEAEHPGTEYLKRYMCDVCGHTTKQYANLMVHMRTHTNEKPYGCLVCERRFSMPSNRDRHMVVHTGEKRYQCQHCNRRFTQSSAVKLHIQTVHLKIPYAPWDKKNRKRRRALEGPGECAPPRAAFDTPADYLNAYITYSDE